MNHYWVSLFVLEILYLLHPIFPYHNDITYPPPFHPPPAIMTSSAPSRLILRPLHCHWYWQINTTDSPLPLDCTSVFIFSLSWMEMSSTLPSLFSVVILQKKKQQTQNWKNSAVTNFIDGPKIGFYYRHSRHGWQLSSMICIL